MYQDMMHIIANTLPLIGESEQVSKSTVIKALP